MKYLDRLIEKLTAKEYEFTFHATDYPERLTYVICWYGDDLQH
jgi:hypothetical protein